MILKMLFRNIFLFYNFLIVINGNNIFLRKVIGDFVLKQPPTKILAYLDCWNKDEKTNLIRSLNSTSIAIQSSNKPAFGLIEDTHHQMFLIDSKCSTFKKVLNEANNRGLFGLPFRWLFIGDIENVSIDYTILTDSRFYVLQPSKNANNTEFIIKAIYKILKSDSKYIENEIAFWNKKFQYYNNLIDGVNRSDLHGVVINVSYVITNNDTLNHLWDYRYKHIDTVSKVNYILVYHLLASLNATANFISTPSWGYKNKTTGTFSGMIGAIQERKVDIGGTVCVFTSDRLNVVEYVALTTDIIFLFVFRAPPLSYVTNVFTMPFERNVWYASFALLTLLTVILYAIVKWEWKDKEFGKNFNTTASVLLPDFIEVLIVNIGGISQQGSESEPRSSSGRITYFFGFIAMMFMYTSYSASIVALLQSTSDSINTVEDLLYSRIKLGCENLPYSKYFFEIEKDPIIRAIYEQKIAPKGSMENFLHIDDGVKRMKDEFFAIHGQSTHIYNVVVRTFQEHEKCALKGIKVLALSKTLMPVGKNTSYKEVLKVGFRKLHESGIQHRENKKLFTEKPVCQGVGGYFIHVGLLETYYAFVIFGIGCATSLVLLILEVLSHRYSERIKCSRFRAI